MKMGIRISIFFVLMVSFSFSQNETEKSNNLVFDGNIKFDNKDFEIAEYNYRIAKSLDSLNYNAPYNLGNSLYKNNLGTDAQIMYKSALKNSSKENKHKGFHNLGNTYMQKEVIKTQLIPLNKLCLIILMMKKQGIIMFLLRNFKKPKSE